MDGNKSPSTAVIVGHARKLAHSGRYSTSAEIRVALEALYEPWRVRMSLRGRHKMLRGLIEEAQGETPSDAH